MSQQYVIFKLNDEYFGVNIAHVMEIIWPQKVFKVPDTPSHVEGLINVRGKVYALLNLKNKLNLPDNQIIDEETKMLIIMINSKTLAFMVDVVEEIISIEDEEIEPVSESVSSYYKKYLKGAAKIQDRFILLIDFEIILNETHK
ncbi:chemotaxis protein CheW [Acetivibrio straminisolvens]|jgi:purine-binding chemotaxis protein CheW|uniref:CheW protein n=1 Tax=Acetivibrio straminisolvens JCM 21531 TaxID=1294263 RepID=W4V702_9FIRM|nr:chemotaxis protein CheW [Acetivibrio straminisolvens]GAE88598.1 CheW protein [Acetivibrio straminisolvens JCM 21531]